MTQDKAAAFGDGQHDEERAELERRAATIERDAAELEADWASLKRKRAA